MESNLSLCILYNSDSNVSFSTDNIIDYLHKYLHQIYVNFYSAFTNTINKSADKRRNRAVLFA